MAIICPTVLAPTIGDFRDSLERVSFAKRIQIDITDGNFASPPSVSSAQIYWNSEQRVDVHVMYDDPYHNLETLIAKQPHMIILHTEAKTFDEAFEHLKHLDLQVGIALLPGTQPVDVEQYLRRADHCLIFGGHLGSYGGEADLDQLDKVAQLRKLNPEIEIGWDGGANEATVQTIAEADVDVINVGSAIQKADNPQGAYATLSEIVQGSNDT